MKPVTYFHEYLVSLGYDSKIAGVSNINNDGGRTCRIDFREGVSEEEQAQIYALRDSYNWDQPDYWVPNVESFKKDIYSILPDTGKLQMAPVLMAIDKSFIDNPENMQIYWRAFLANRPSWMTNELAAQIDTLAKTYNIPIEVGQKPTWMEKAKSFFNFS